MPIEFEKALLSSESLPDAEFAERAAAAVKAHLLALGYPERNIIHLTGSKAGKSGIQKYLETWLPLNVKEDSRVFVYFSGHGAPDAETNQACLVPWDGDAKFLKDTGYPVKKLYESLNALKAKDVILAMDACFSGTGGRSVLAKGARPLVTKVDTGLGGASKIVALAAAAGDEITGSEETQSHGHLLPRVQDSARREGREQTPQLMMGRPSGASLRLK